MADKYDFPKTLESAETYCFMGLTPELAQDIWAKYISRPADQPHDFLTFATARVRWSPEPDVCCSDEDWDECLSRCGINKRLKDAILNPEFDDIKYTQSAKYWAIDALEIGYLALKRKLTTLQPAGSTHAHPSYTPSHAHPSYTPSHAHPPPFKQLKEKGKGKGKSIPLGAIAEESSAPTVQMTVEPAPILPPGHVTLWTGVSRERCEGLINPVTQELDVGVLRSSHPTDFSGTGGLIYFTPQMAVAERYAAWARSIVPISEAVIVQINVPFSFSEQKVDGNSIAYHLFNDNNPDCEWKQLVWHSKRSRREPRSISHVRRFGLLIGHCTTGFKIERLNSHRLVEEQHILRVDDSGSRVRAIQWVLQGRYAEEDFNEKCRGKAWIRNIGQLDLSMGK